MKEFKYAVGQTIYTKYGKGIIKDIDTEDKHFTHFVHCEDGTKMWCHEDDLSNKPIKKTKKAEETK